MEQHVGSIRPIGQVPDLVHHEHVRVRVGGQRLIEMPMLAGIRKIFDQFGRGGKQSFEAILDGPISDGHCQVRFPPPLLTPEDQGAPFADEVQPQVGA